MADTPQTIVITGASDGIGAVAARELAAAGHHVVMVGRSPEKTHAVARAAGIADVHLADFTRLDEVRRLADEVRERYPRIDVLANNAGGIFTGPTRTDDGFEKTFQVNHLAPFLLTHHLIDRLLDSRALVVNTASIAARMFSALDLDDLNTWTRFTPNRAYGNAKLAGILFARGLTTHYAARGLTAISFHPGVVATSFASDTTSAAALALPHRHEGVPGLPRAGWGEPASVPRSGPPRRLAFGHLLRPGRTPVADHPGRRGPARHRRTLATQQRDARPHLALTATPPAHAAHGIRWRRRSAGRG